MAQTIVGRDAEVAALRAFLEDTGDIPAALVLEGEAGIGKSTLWLAGVDAARSQGWSVLVARPTHAERGLGNAGLGDLLDGRLDDLLPELAAPRRRALEVALLRKEPTGDPIDRRTLAVAVGDVLRLLSNRRSTLIAVDDVQWLDSSTSQALAFALRRCEGSLKILLARR